ncbi:putative aldehyde dehydrogenase [Rhodovulum sp. PH10]|uniref:aldehyde dehydrogenase family protein n=1 Tax=Rhodovulum sp. PH10 TaxID=1187851 RepID=UPI00027C268A|nr:aldehyde dehydrogenase family protein [Rhodovulum sp. PH10]EJW11361.1 putative aldehyde dehydrogenase [Rhodovulum sp. PH10]
MTIHRNYIAGAWVEATDAAPDLDPSDLDDVVGDYALASRHEAEQAIAAAKAALIGWACATPATRVDVLMRIATELVARRAELGRLLSREHGKPLRDGVWEVAHAGRIFAWFAGEIVRPPGEGTAWPGVGSGRVHGPAGVVALVTPTSCPMSVAAWKIAGALACGDTVVFKPAGLVPGSAWALTEIVARAGLPPGVFNLVMGSAADIGPTLLTHRDVDTVSFTGSVATGRRVAKAASGASVMKAVRMDLGGNSPLVVVDDADLEVATACAITGAFHQTGQCCNASTRLVVTEAIHDRFVRALTEKLKALVVDGALAPGTRVGPVVDRCRLEQTLRSIGLAEREGARLHWGGALLRRERRGHYLQPALLTDVDNAMRVAREEIFGPVACVVRVRDYEDAKAVANDTCFRLSAGICTTNPACARDFKRSSVAKVVRVNLPTAGAPVGIDVGVGLDVDIGADDHVIAQEHLELAARQLDIAYVV